MACMCVLNNRCCSETNISFRGRSVRVYRVSIQIQFPPQSPESIFDTGKSNQKKWIQWKVTLEIRKEEEESILNARMCCDRAQPKTASPIKHPFCLFAAWILFIRLVQLIDPLWCLECENSNSSERKERERKKHHSNRIFEKKNRSSPTRVLTRKKIVSIDSASVAGPQSERN